MRKRHSAQTDAFHKAFVVSADTMRSFSHLRGGLCAPNAGVFGCREFRLHPFKFARLYKSRRVEGGALVALVLRAKSP